MTRLARRARRVPPVLRTALVRRMHAGWGRRAGAPEAGDTLLEIIFAIIILGIASVAMLGAFATSISASSVHRTLTTDDTAVRTANQQALSQMQQSLSPTYQSCAPLNYYQQGGAGQVTFALPAGYSAQVTSIKYWNGTAFTTDQSQCDKNSPQWITVSVTNPAGTTYTTNVIIANPYSPPVPAVGPAYQLVFVQQPGGATVSSHFAIQPVVRVEDAAGNLVTTDLSPVTLSITTGTGTSGAGLSYYCVGVENSGVIQFNGCSIDTAGLNYQLTASDPGLVSAISQPFNVYIQLTQPVITSLTPSATTAGAINVSFTGSTNAPGNQTYTATACANSGVGFGCVTQTPFTSGSQITGLTPGTSYYVTITANSMGPLYLPATSAPAGPTPATVQLNAPGTPNLDWGTVAGSVSVSFSTPTPAAVGQQYTATACTDAALTQGCVTGTISPGGNLSGLSYATGSPGTSYYVRVVAAASVGFLASNPSGVSAPHAAVSQVGTPGAFSAASSTTTSAALQESFTASPGATAPASYTATVCTDAAMTASCSTQAVTPGSAQLTGLAAGTLYYVTVRANSPSGAYLSATTAPVGPFRATVQLTAPTSVSVAYGTAAGAVLVNFNAPGNAAASQTYTAKACSDSGMTTGCVTNANYTAGSNLTGLAYTLGAAGSVYYTTIQANASTGYFASPSAGPFSHLDTSQLNAPGTPSGSTSPSTPGAVVVTFTAPSGTAPVSYTAKACTNSGMSAGCVTGSITPGGTLTGLSQGVGYYLQITANPPTGYVASLSPVSSSTTQSSVQLSTPVISAVTPSATNAGQLSIAYTGSSNAPGGQSYTATLCTDFAMSLNCTTRNSYVSGTSISLTPGTLYYSTITAVGSSGYLAATSAPVGPTIATVQLNTPSTPVLAYGAVAGSINVTASSSNAPAGQIYAMKACTNAGMSTGCVTANITSGSDLTGLVFTQGSPGTAYYVTATANASSGYLASATSSVAGPQADTSKINSPGTPSVASSATTPGAITATFSASSGPSLASHTAKACTNSAMTTGCVTLANYTSGAQFTGLSQGSSYFVTITAISSNPAYGSATSAVSATSALATVQLSSPVITAVSPSATTPGQITIAFTGSANAGGGQAYTAKACTDAAMTTGCVTQANYTSGAQLTGLTAGSSYYVTITAVASTGYLGATTSVAGPVMATIQLNAPTGVTLAYGSVAGSIKITFTASSNAPGGQTYTAKACTDSGMTTACVTGAIVSGGDLTGLSFTNGAAGQNYYVTVKANATGGYLASASSAVAGPQSATSRLSTATNLVAAPSSTTQGAITVTFTTSSGASPASYTATTCTDAAMTLNCATKANYTSGVQITGLVAGTSYYATITAIPSGSAFVPSVSSIVGPAVATIQLQAPTGVTLSYGTVAGSLRVSFTTSPNAPVGQSYTAKACTNAAMTTGCVTGTIINGQNLLGLAYAQGSVGTSYYVTVTANASSGYLASAPSAVAGPQADTSQLAAPGTPTITSSTTTAGAVKATFASSSGVAPDSYSAIACTNSSMNVGCITVTNVTSGGPVAGLVQGTSYWAKIVAVAATGYTPATSGTSSSSAIATTQLSTPQVTSILPSLTTAGQITITYIGSTNGPVGQQYTAIACTDVGMTQNCVAHLNYLSGSQFTGLLAGTSYNITLTAPASPGYLAVTTPAYGPTLATVQLNSPSVASLLYGTVAGSINVSFAASSNAPAVQTYRVSACTNAAMSTGCVINSSFTSSTDFTGLAYVQGAAGTSYYVTVTANASAGFLSATSAAAGPQGATSILNAPGVPVVASSLTTAGAITATFSAPSGVAPASYTATACTDVAFTQNCAVVAGYSSGAQITGLVPGTAYFVRIAETPPAGFLAGATVASAGSALATTQLDAPSGVTLGYGTVAGSIAVTFTGSSNAAVGQAYSAKACTNAAMTTGCVTGTVTSGGNLTGLAYVAGTAGTSYYVTVAASASAGYLASAPSGVAGPQADTSALGAPGIPTVASSPTTAGAVTITFAPPGGVAPTGYSATACTNAAMTTGCVTQSGVTSGTSITGLVAGTGYYATVTALAPSGFAPSTSAASAAAALATTQLNAPVITAVVASSTTMGVLNVSFTAPSNAAVGQTYTARACSDAGMTAGCVTQANFTSGAQLAGLSQATPYYVTVTADASAGYLAATSSTSGPTSTAVQLNAPSGVTLAYGTVAGSIAVTFTGSSNAPGSQAYTATACTNVAMTTGCVTGAITSGANLTGLAYVAGSAGTSYYVTVTATGSSGYVAATSPVAGPQADTSALNAPGAPTGAPSSTTSGAVVVTFTAPSGTAPASFTASACTNAAMTTGCVSQGGYTSGTQLVGLTAGTAYYVQIAETAPVGYVATNSAVSAAAALATTQLNAPSGVTLAYGTVAGSIKVTFAGSSNAPGGQTYTAMACTNAAMTTGCVTNAAFTSGANLSGLNFSAGSAGTSYYVTVGANASSGYLSGTSGVAGPQVDTSQLGAPGTPSVASSTTTAGALTATFSASGGVAPTSYSATACTNAAMTTGCVTQTSYTSGAQLTGLVAGTSYFVQITAVAPAGFASATSGVSITSAAASIQLNSPSGVTLAYGTVAGSIKVTFAGSSNAPGGQTYTATGCTNVAMSAGCVTDTTFASTNDLTGLAYAVGSPGTAYYVTVVPNASPGYLASSPTAPAGPQADTSQLNAPGTPAVASSTTTAGAVTATYGAAAGTSPTSYTATVCTNAGMSTGCVTKTNYTSGAQITGLTAGTSYFAQVNEVAPAGYISASSAVSASAAAATTQLSAPTGVSVATSSTTAGAITVSFTGSSNAPGGQSYTATACTNVSMTSSCVSQTGYTSGSQLTGLTPGTSYYANVTAAASTGYLAVTSGTSGTSALATTQLVTPVVTAVLSSTTTAGQLTVSYTGSPNAPGGQSYTAIVCTNAAMTTGCVTKVGYASGTQVTGLTAGTNYYATVTAVASPGYLAATTATAGPALATVQLGTPSGLTLAYGTVAGSINVSFTGSANAPSGQSYTATACTNPSMNQNCVTDASFIPGQDLTGLTYSPGSAGTGYRVRVFANASAGYLQSSNSSTAGPQNATSSLNAPGTPSVAPSSTTAGAITATFSSSSGTAPASYTATACTDAAMATGCVTKANYTSGSQLTGLVPGTSYFVTITAVAPSAAYVSATSAVSASSVLATTQLATPGAPTLAYGSIAGSINVTVSSANAPGGQLYTVKACTNAGMTTGCVTNGAFTSGNDLTGLAFSQGSAGTSYYVTAVANASSGYLVSGTSAVAGPQAATSRLNAPGTPAVASSTTTAGALTATFTSVSGTAAMSYSAVACTNAGMSAGCVTQTAYTSGAQLSGLVAGTSYYVQMTANPPAGFVGSNSSVSVTSAPATVQLATPNVVLGYGATAGSIDVNPTSSNAPGSQTYTVVACTNAAMTTGCVTNASFSPGTDLTGLAYSVGAAGTAYYVTVDANASSGYLSSATSAASGPQNDTSQLGAPGTPTVSSSTTTAGAVTASFGAASGVAPASYSIAACTNAAMTTGCATQAGYASGAQMTGLTAGSSYFVQITSVPSAGYVANASAVSASSAKATTQLNAPAVTGTATGSGATHGIMTMTFTASSNAPGGQSYTAKVCTNAAMTLNCVTKASYTSGAQVTGLTQGASYYGTVTADPSTGYLASTSNVAGPRTIY